MRAGDRQAPRVMVFGFYGMGNLGNEACLEAFLRGLRSVLPRARPWCVGTGPDRVTASTASPRAC